MRPIRTLVLLVLATVAFVARGATDYSGLVAFGDSLTDMGNRYVHSEKPNLVFKKTWVALLAGPGMMGLPALKPSGIKSYYGGTNYAVGGAGTEYTAALNRERNGKENLTVQISGRYLNPAFNTDGVNKNALHVIRIGTNDLMAALISPAQISSGWTGLDQAGIDIARSVEGQIQALASAGVRYVLWSNLNDTGKIPSVITKVNQFGGAQSAFVLGALTQATLAHNREMDLAIARLEKTNPGLRIIKFDAFAMFETVALDPAKYGLTDVTSGANDDSHLFAADGLHPTQKGQRLLAEFTWATLSAVPAAPTVAAAKTDRP